MRPYVPRGIFEPEVMARPCRYPCPYSHTHDEVPPARYVENEAGIGVDVLIPRGATAQNGYTEVVAEDQEVLYQCRLCENLLRGNELEAHVCPKIRAQMEES